MAAPPHPHSVADSQYFPDNNFLSPSPILRDRPEQDAVDILKALQTSSFVTRSSARIATKRQIATDCDIAGPVCSMKEDEVTGCDATPALAHVSQCFLYWQLLR